MFKEIINKLKKPLSKSELLEMARNFPAQESEKNKIFLLKRLLLNSNEPNIIHDLLEIIIHNSAVPLEKLNELLLDGIGRSEIKTLELFFTAIKRLKDNQDFILGIKNNTLLYPGFIDMYKKAVNDFNIQIQSYIEQLEMSETIGDINSIKANTETLEKARTYILEEYPEEAVPEELAPAKILLKNSEFTDAVEEAEQRIAALDEATKNLKEKEELYDNLRADSNPGESAITFAWNQLKAAHINLDNLLCASYEKEHKEPRATNTFTL